MLKQPSHSAMRSVDIDNLLHLSDSVVFKDLRGRYIDCNEIALNALQLPGKDELVNKFAHDFVWGRDTCVTHWRENELKVISTQKPLQTCEEIVHKNCKYTYLATVMPVLQRKKNIGTVKILKFQQKTNLETESNSYGVSKRELECIYHLAKGLTIKEIALRMQISPRTAGHHLEHAKTKLNCYRRSDLILKVLQMSCTPDQPV